MILRWFLSSTVRQAVDLRSQVLKFLSAQRDILSPEAVQAIEASAAELQQTIASDVDKKALLAAMEQTEGIANKWLKPYPNASMRENVEVVLVAIAVAMGVRTFFLQPFKIPTGSMQPTLYGITMRDMRGEADCQIPGRWGRFCDACFKGTFYHSLAAEADGELVGFGPREHVVRFLNKQAIIMRYRDGGQTYEKSHYIWFSPDDNFQYRSGLRDGQTFRKGETILKLAETSGDHLFVDRLSYNFRRPQRGEIIVFETRGIPGLPQDQFYIKRMVALGDDRVRIGNDRHLVINGQRLDSATPHFENVYFFETNAPAKDSQYSGHVNEVIAREHGKPGLAPLFPEGAQEFTVRGNHYMVMGDNTLNSYDSRAWGDFSRTNVIGKSCFVYWPFSSPTGNRFGWSHR